LAAKPVIDIQVGVRTLDNVEIVSTVESLGYEYVPEFEDECRIAATSGDGSTVAAATRCISSSDPTRSGGIDTAAFGTGFERTTTTGIGMRNSSCTLPLRIGMTAGRTPMAKSDFIRSIVGRSIAGARRDDGGDHDAAGDD